MVKEFVIDLFCGAGGTSTGAYLSNKKKNFNKELKNILNRLNIKEMKTVVIACVNHDKKALESHRLNHSKARHYREDIRNPEVVFMLYILVKALRKKYPGCIITIWASLECTNFSKAKGGQPRKADSRTLANHLDMYIEWLKPDYLKIENVTEFMSWGPLCEKGKPVSKKKGIDYLRWVDTIRKYGYRFDSKELNSADYGAYTSRNRFFAQFAKGDLPISWPEQTHTKNPSKDTGLFEYTLKKHKPVKEVLDFNNEGKSILNRKIPLKPNTLDVILKGTIKALKEGENQFLYKYYGNGDNYNSINSPAGTVTTKDRFAKVHLIFNQYITGNTSSIEKPLGTLTTNPKQNLLTFIMNPSHGGHTSSVDKPCPVVIARQDKAPLYLIRVLMEEYGIIDIKMRMLTIEELLQIQGFPKDYKLIGTQADKKKFIGNSVEVTTAKKIFEAKHTALVEYFDKKNAA